MSETAISRFTISRPLALRTLRLRLFLLTLVSLKLPEVLRLTSRFCGVVLLGNLPRSLSGHSILMISAPRAPSQRVPWPGPHPAEIHHANILKGSRSRHGVVLMLGPAPGKGGRLRVDESATMPPIHHRPNVDQEPRSAAMGPMAADPRQAADRQQRVAIGA